MEATSALSLSNAIVATTVPLLRGAQQERQTLGKKLMVLHRKTFFIFLKVVFAVADILVGHEGNIEGLRCSTGEAWQENEQTFLSPLLPLYSSIFPLFPLSPLYKLYPHFSFHFSNSLLISLSTRQTFSISSLTTPSDFL
ncbi:hypothetical protein Pcinc_027798 [Petrolisthes cinctipes]|uniref:Uncharacterized protein n=1 Tax=Petrolisthes cinctipes TaxID=88211 RepID=A0AAE1F3D7_PETCI|nr:hypothetical protein Pcinc_027798 [Petrolisthes cinctipes]